MIFDYSAPAELFLTKRANRTRPRYHRFETAAEAIQYAIENLPALSALDAAMQIGDERFDREKIQSLYDRSEYPLLKPAA